MPGRRNFAAERAQHNAPALQQQYAALLRRELPQHDRALIGRPAILAHLAALGVRRLNRGPLTWRIVNRWRTHHACPILRGNHHPKSRATPLCTSYALTAWVLAQFTSDDLFSVVDTAHALPTTVSFPRAEAAA